MEIAEVNNPHVAMRLATVWGARLVIMDPEMFDMFVSDLDSLGCDAYRAVDKSESGATHIVRDGCHYIRGRENAVESSGQEDRQG